MSFRATASMRKVEPRTSGLRVRTMGDTAATLTHAGATDIYIWTAALTTDRDVALSTSGPPATGAQLKVIRAASSSGAFALNVGTGPLAALQTGDWCLVEYDGAAWTLADSGSL